MNVQLRFWLYNTLLFLLLIYSHILEYGIVYYIYVSITYILGLKSLILIYIYIFDKNTYNIGFKKIRYELAINYYNINLLNTVNIVYLLILFHFQFYFTSIFALFTIISENILYYTHLNKIKNKK